LGVNDKDGSSQKSLTSENSEYSYKEYNDKTPQTNKLFSINSALQHDNNYSLRRKTKNNHKGNKKQIQESKNSNKLDIYNNDLSEHNEEINKSIAEGINFNYEAIYIKPYINNAYSVWLIKTKRVNNEITQTYHELSPVTQIVENKLINERNINEDEIISDPCKHEKGKCHPIKDIEITYKRQGPGDFLVTDITFHQAYTAVAIEEKKTIAGTDRPNDKSYGVEINEAQTIKIKNQAYGS